MYGIFTYIWPKFMVNVGKYTIHGASGIGNASEPTKGQIAWMFVGCENGRCPDFSLPHIETTKIHIKTPKVRRCFFRFHISGIIKLPIWGGMKHYKCTVNLEDFPVKKCIVWVGFIS